MEEELKLENSGDEELKREESKTEVTEEERMDILCMAVNDWVNEFTGSVFALELAIYSKKVSNLFLTEKEKYFPKLFWERYGNYSKEKILLMENEYPEFREMGKAVSESRKLMEEVFSFIEENKEEETADFWDKIEEFYEKSKLIYDRFQENKIKLREKMKK